MSRFYVTMKGKTDKVHHATGTAASGVTAHVRGWDIGIRVSIYDVEGQDKLLVELTPGSNGAGHDKVIGEFTMSDRKGK